MIYMTYLSIRQKFIISCAFIAMLTLFTTSCQRKTQLNNSGKVDNLNLKAKRELIADSTEVHVDTLFFEDFEGNKKSSYSSSDITFKSGTWHLEDAIIGSNNPYAQPNNSAIRIRNNGTLRMEFDIETKKDLLIEITASIHKGDKHSNWGLYASTDKGISYQRLFLIRDTDSFERKSFRLLPINKKAVRFEVRKLSGGPNQINFDDFAILTFSGK